MYKTENVLSWIQNNYIVFQKFCQTFLDSL